MTDDELIGTKEAAGILGCDKSTVTRYAHGGRLPFRRLSEPDGPMLFHRADVQELRSLVRGEADGIGDGLAAQTDPGSRQPAPP